MLRNLRLIVFLALSATMANAQPCQPYWSGVAPGTWSVQHMATFDDGTGPALFAIMQNEVRRWNGAVWTSVNQGVVGTPLGFRVLDEGSGPALHLSCSVAGPYVLHRWNGTHWVPATPGLLTWIDIYDHTFPHVTVTTASGPVIYGMRRVSAVSWLTRWDGTTWHHVSQAAGANLLEFDDGTGPALYTVGAPLIDGIQTGGFARFDGQSWTPLLTPETRIVPNRAPVAGTINGSPAIYVIGHHAPDGGLATRPSVYRLDSSGNVTNIGIPVWNWQPNVMFSFQVLHIFDEGAGPALYLGGSFPYDTSSVLRRGRLGRWDGTQWHQMGVGLRGEVKHLASMTLGQTPVLFAGGTVWEVGDGRVTGLVQWVGCPNCYANCDHSAVKPAVNVDDFLCYISRLASLDPYADCNVDGLLNIEDFTCFISQFAAAHAGAPGLACP
jgi:hypothetical protein